MAADLAAIRTKVRRLTRSPSTQQLSNTDLDEYINTFILYDFPEELRLFTLKTTLTFYTTPFVDVYDSNVVAGTNVNSNFNLNDFKNRYISIHPPLYVAGNQSKLYQSRDQFFNQFPFTASRIQIGTGDGVTTQFTGTLAGTPILQHKVTFSSTDAAGAGVVMHDVPVVAANQIPTLDGNLYAPGNEPNPAPTVVTPTNTLNYETGVYTVTFTGAPANGDAVFVQTVPYSAALPRAMLYYDNVFTLRPVPDQVYAVQFDAYIRPTEFLSTNPGQLPELEQWWQYIAYGAAKKIFEDRSDIENVQIIMPEFKKQERLVLRRTLVQRNNERTATIYTQQTELGFNGNNWWGP